MKFFQATKLKVGGASPSKLISLRARGSCTDGFLNCVGSTSAEGQAFVYQ